jgi:hypothetical protein
MFYKALIMPSCHRSYCTNWQRFIKINVNQGSCQIGRRAALCFLAGGLGYTSIGKRHQNLAAVTQAEYRKDSRNIYL